MREEIEEGKRKLVIILLLSQLVITSVIRRVLQAVPSHQSLQRCGCGTVPCQSISGRSQSQHIPGSGNVDPLLASFHNHRTWKREGLSVHI